MSRKIASLSLMFLFMMTGVSFSAQGDLDTTFNSDGVVTYSGADRDYQSYRFLGGIAVQQDAKIVVVTGNKNGEMLILRYNKDGGLDTAFNGTGIIKYYYYNIFSHPTYGHGIAIQSDGKIVVTGSSGSTLLVLRYNPDGTPDSSFNGIGAVTNSCEGRTAIALQQDGRIVVAGSVINLADGTWDISVLRFNGNGSLDDTFGVNGVVKYNSGFSDSAESLAIQTDGKSVVTGQRVIQSSHFDVITLRYNSQGTLDTSFGAGGIVVFDSGADEEGHGVAIQQDGKIVVVGEGYNSANHSTGVILFRYNSDGTPDTSFGGNGIVRYDTGPFSTLYGNAVTLQKDGKILVTGQVFNTTQDMVILRFDGNGSSDSTFGVSGAVTYNSGKNDQGFALALQEDWKILVAGVTGTDSLWSVLTMRFIGYQPGKVGLFRPSDGTFYLDANGSGTWDGCGTDQCLHIGMTGDIPLVGDWNGNGSSKVGLFRPSDGTFYLDYNGNGQWDGCGTDRCLSIGMNGDIPLVGDWNGSGTSKVGAFRPSDGTFYLDYNGSGTWEGCGTDRCLQIGLNGDIPLVGDWNASGTTKVGAFRPADGTFYLDYNGNGTWEGCGTDRCLHIGMLNDIPLVGDWNGSGTSKVGAFRPSDGTFYLDYNGSGTWEGCGTDRCLQIGMNGDVPLVGDWNGTGTSKVGAFRPGDGTFYLDYNGSGTWEGCGTDRCLSIGMNGDTPLVGKW
jgi:uncharacterized delta-60 repeat protein